MGTTRPTQKELWKAIIEFAASCEDYVQAEEDSNGDYPEAIRNESIRTEGNLRGMLTELYKKPTFLEWLTQGFSQGE